MNETIYKRKSIRKYDQAKLDEGVLAKVREKIADLTPLYPEIRYYIDIVNKAKGSFGVSAPHYLVFCSEEKDGALENIGFVGQQMDLFFSASGLGSCWLGMAKPEDRDASALPHVICMAFGAPAEPLHRELAEFKRKTLAEMSEGSDPRLEAARLAPSARNGQNWFFVAESGTDSTAGGTADSTASGTTGSIADSHAGGAAGDIDVSGSGKIHCYRKTINPVVGLVMSKFPCIDMGIALCHIAEESESFEFGKDAGAPERKGYVYAGTVGV